MYYVYFRTKDGKKETAYSCNESLIRLKFDIECIYRYSKIYKCIKEMNKIIEWRVYDSNKNLLEIGVVEETEVKSKDIIWYKKEER